MITIKVDKAEVEIDYSQELEKWFQILEVLGKEISPDKLEFYYSFGSFLPKTKNREAQYLENWNKYTQFLFDERLNWELSKVRVDLTLKMGKFAMTDRMSKGFIPDSILKMVTELTKIKMLFEFELNGDELIRDSIPPLNKDYFDGDLVREIFKLMLGESGGVEEMDLDSLLDKISEGGMESLTEEERNFLNRRSKEI